MASESAGSVSDSADSDDGFQADWGHLAQDLAQCVKDGDMKQAAMAFYTSIYQLVQHEFECLQARLNDIIVGSDADSLLNEGTEEEEGKDLCVGEASREFISALAWELNSSLGSTSPLTSVIDYCIEELVGRGLRSANGIHPSLLASVELRLKTLRQQAVYLTWFQDAIRYATALSNDEPSARKDYALAPSYELDVWLDENIRPYIPVLRARIHNRQKNLVTSAAYSSGVTKRESEQHQGDFGQGDAQGWIVIARFLTFCMNGATLDSSDGDGSVGVLCMMLRSPLMLCFLMEARLCAPSRVPSLQVDEMLQTLTMKALAVTSLPCKSAVRRFYSLVKAIESCALALTQTSKVGWISAIERLIQRLPSLILTQDELHQALPATLALLRLALIGHCTPAITDMLLWLTTLAAPRSKERIETSLYTRLKECKYGMDVVAELMELFYCCLKLKALWHPCVGPDLKRAKLTNNVSVQDRGEVSDTNNINETGGGVAESLVFRAIFGPQSGSDSLGLCPIKALFEFITHTEFESLGENADEVLEESFQDTINTLTTSHESTGDSAKLAAVLLMLSDADVVTPTDHVIPRLGLRPADSSTHSADLSDHRANLCSSALVVLQLLTMVHDQLARASNIGCAIPSESWTPFYFYDPPLVSPRHGSTNIPIRRRPPIAALVSQLKVLIEALSDAL